MCFVNINIQYSLTKYGFQLLTCDDIAAVFSFVQFQVVQTSRCAWFIWENRCAMCESNMVTLRRAEAQVQYRNCAESALTIHVYFTHCASAHGRALRKNKVRLGIHLRREWDCSI